MVMMSESLILILVVYGIFLYISMSETKDDNMISPYECGFDPMMGGRVSFSYRFFLISILFLVFDVEVTLLIPLPYIEVDFYVIFGVLYFMMVLLMGLVYEYYNGVLTWV